MELKGRPCLFAITRERGKERLVAFFSLAVFPSSPLPASLTFFFDGPTPHFSS
jgi:hypothetical protein